MEIQPKQPTTKAPAETFTGEAWFDVIAIGSSLLVVQAGTGPLFLWT